MLLSDFTFQAGPQPKQQFILTPHQQMLLMPIGDVHAWSAGWPEQKFREHVQWGVDRGAYFLGMGEYLDFTSTTQREILSRLRGSQQAQIDDMVRGRVEQLFELMKTSQGRWLGMLEGHHFYQFQDGTTTDQYLCKLLGTRFLGTSVLMDVRLAVDGRKDGCTVTVFAHHGAGSGGRRQGSHLHRLEDLLSWIEADIYLMGHTHAKVSGPVDRLYRTPGGHLYYRTKILARTGGFLRGYVAVDRDTARVSSIVPAERLRGSYVEKAALAPSALGGLVLSLGYKRVKEEGLDIVIPDLHHSV